MRYVPSSMRCLRSWFLVVALAAAALAYAAHAAAPTEQLVIDAAKAPVTFVVEIAATPEARQQGLMFREHLAPLHGMLFDFGTTRPVAMWMKNTKLPLDMIFIDRAGLITSIAADTVPESETIIPSQGPVRAVLEIGAGESARLGIRTGDRVRYALFPGS